MPLRFEYEYREGERMQTSGSFFPIALINEGRFTNEVLILGGQHLRTAHYAAKGRFYCALSSLSTGIVRLGKLCLLLDYYIRHQGKFPSLNALKTLAPSDLSTLYAQSQTIVQARSLAIHHLQRLGREEHVGLLNVLSRFTQGHPYCEVDLLTGATGHGDPLVEWALSVDAPLYRDCLSPRQKASIRTAADDLGEGLGAFTQALTVAPAQHRGDFGLACTRSKLHDALGPHRLLLVAQVVRYWVEILVELEAAARNVRNEHIPSFAPLFAFFANDDSELMKHTRWKA